MHRQIVWAGQVPLETDVLNTNRHALIALGLLTQAILGTGTYVDGLPCTPGAGLTVSVGIGSIYSLAAIDATSYSSLAANTTQIAKQGILLAPVSLNCPAPITTGQSINYLVEVQFQEVDGDATVLPYYNSANPAIAWSGPGGSGAASYTTRKDICAVQVKAGVSATTGSQVTPAADAGWTGLYVVSVAYGATTISTGNISILSGAPFITLKLPAAAPINNPTFTGTPAAPTPTTGDNSTKLATTAFVASSIFGLGTQIYVNSSRGITPGVYVVDTTGVTPVNSIVLTLPATPAHGDSFTFIDPNNNWGGNYWSLDPNGQTFEGASGVLISDTPDLQWSIFYNHTRWEFF